MKDPKPNSAALHQKKLQDLEKTWDRMSREAKPPTKQPSRNKLFSWPKTWTTQPGFLERSDIEHERKREK